MASVAQSNREECSALVRDAVASGRGALDEWEAKRLLAAYGVPVPRGGLARTEGEALTLAASLGGPVVLKAVGGSIHHKTEARLVALGLRTSGEIADAYRGIKERAGKDLEAVLVEAMVAGVQGVPRRHATRPRLRSGRHVRPRRRHDRSVPRRRARCDSPRRARRHGAPRADPMRRSSWAPSAVSRPSTAAGWSTSCWPSRASPRTIPRSPRSTSTRSSSPATGRSRPTRSLSSRDAPQEAGAAARLPPGPPRPCARRGRSPSSARPTTSTSGAGPPCATSSTAASRVRSIRSAPRRRVLRPAGVHQRRGAARGP